MSTYPEIATVATAALRYLAKQPERPVAHTELGAALHRSEGETLDAMYYLVAKGHIDAQLHRNHGGSRDWRAGVVISVTSQGRAAAPRAL